MTEYPDSKLMTEQENRLYDLCTQVFNDFTSLPDVLGVDAQAIAFHTNAIKSIIMSLPVTREFMNSGMYDNQAIINKSGKNE